MIAAICELWKGNISPMEQCGAQDLKANQLSCMIDKSQESLWTELNAEQKELFQEYMECSEAYLLRMMELSFCDGFRIGGKLAMDICCDQ